MKPLFSWLQISIAYLCFVHLLVHSEKLEEGLEGLQSQTAGFKFDLRYKKLIATLHYTDILDPYGNNPHSMWTNIADQIELDSKRTPYQEGKTTDRYDVWPKLTTQSGFLSEPTYLIRFSLEQAPGCVRRQVERGLLIDRGLLVGVARMFDYMASFTPLASHAFNGYISNGQGILFQFRLYNTGSQPARRDKQRNIEAADLDIINKGRRTILGQTTSSDLLIFVGSSGGYFYHAMNRPGDSAIIRRNAYLLPVSSASLWTFAIPLDLIWNTPEFARFIDTVVWPIFNPTHRLGYARVIFVDYICRGTTLRGLQAMLVQKGIYYGPLYYINLESPQDPPPPYGLESFVRLDPIRLSGHTDIQNFVESGFGRIVPPYPWYYWDVPPDSVGYPEKATAQGLIDIIRSNRVPSGILSDRNSSSVALNGSAASALTQLTSRYSNPEPEIGSESDLSSSMARNDTCDDSGYNDRVDSIPSFPALSLGDCLQNSTDRVVNLTQIPIHFGQIPTSSIIETS